MGSGSSKLYRREDLNYAPNVYPASVESALSDDEIAAHQKLLDHAGLLPPTSHPSVPMAKQKSNVLYLILCLFVFLFFLFSCVLFVSIIWTTPTKKKMRRLLLDSSRSHSTSIRNISRRRLTNLIGTLIGFFKKKKKEKIIATLMRLFGQSTHDVHGN